jgi:RES domain-containing protein
MLHGARWNSPGRRVIYAAETYAGALLETLVHASGCPTDTGLYRDRESDRLVHRGTHAGRRAALGIHPRFETARALGDRWYDERSTPVLIVPSIVTLVERNVLINQEHPDFLRIQVSQPKPVRWGYAALVNR